MLKHLSSKSIKTKANFFHISLSHVCAYPQIHILLETSSPTHLTHHPEREKNSNFLFSSLFSLISVFRIKTTPNFLLNPTINVIGSTK